MPLWLLAVLGFAAGLWTGLFTGFWLLVVRWAERIPDENLDVAEDVSLSIPRLAGHQRRGGSTSGQESACHRLIRRRLLS